jgi:hypothetical protein
MNIYTAIDYLTDDHKKFFESFLGKIEYIDIAHPLSEGEYVAIKNSNNNKRNIVFFPEHFTREDKLFKKVAKTMFVIGLEYNCLKLGFGEGALALTEFCGGIILDDITGHTNTVHNCYHANNNTIRGSFKIESNHDKMMYPYDIDHEVLVFSAEYLSDKYTVNKKPIKLCPNFVEPEVVYYTDNTALAIQESPHTSNSIGFKAKVSQLINKYAKI